MIDMSECFNMIGTNGCMDVASSLGLQGIDKSMGSICIPVYGPFFMKILIGQDCGFICNSIQEFTVVKQLSENCGTATITLNLLEMDILTLAGAVLSYTPNTGMNCFVKKSVVDIAQLTDDLLSTIVHDVGIHISPTSGVVSLLSMADGIIEAAFNKLLDLVNGDFGSKGIAVRPWEELPELYRTVRESGEMQEMRAYRERTGAFVL